MPLICPWRRRRRSKVSDVSPEPRTGVLVDLVTPHEVSEAPPPIDPLTGAARRGDMDPEKEPCVRLTGRLGTDVHYRETRTGTLIGAFPIAVTWRRSSATSTGARSRGRTGSPA